jgi:transcriptional regulator with XRE-family HTH domain
MDSNNDLVNEKGSQLSTQGGRIREERLKKGLSQNEFAKLAHVHRQTQINYEQGERKPDTDYLLAIAEMGVDVEYVLTGKSPRETLGAYHAILEEILIELDVYKGLRPAWESAFRLVLADREARFSDGRDSRSGLDAVLGLLRKSPLLLSGPGELVDLIERVEFVAETGGRRLSALQKAKAVYQLFQKKKAGSIEYVDLEMVRAVLEQAP